MHGIVFTELARFVIERHGEPAWKSVLADSGLAQQVYMPVREYPDEQLVRLLASTAGMARTSTGDLLEAFGAFVVPTFVSIYGAMVKKSWHTLDLLEHTESVMHRAVRIRNSEATPPRLQVQRTAPNEVVIRYASPRRMCRLARGIITGVSAHYGEAVQIAEASCMLAGADACTITVRT